MAGTSVLPPSRLIAAACKARGGADARKQTDRLLSSLDAAAGDSSAGERLARKFIAANSKSTVLNALSDLLSRSSPLALPIYQQINEIHWFKWNLKLAAEVITLLEEQNRAAEAEIFLSDAISRLKSPRELNLFYSNLIEAFASRGLKQQMIATYARARDVGLSGRNLHESMIKSLCSIGMICDAERAFDEMQSVGFKPSAFEYRLIVQGYGRLGLFMGMRRVIGDMENNGFKVDLICANIILSCYGGHGKLVEMLSWIRKVKELNIGFSVRTLNCVLNSCHLVVGLMEDLGSLPLSIQGLIEKIEGSVSPSSATQGLLVREAVGLGVLDECLNWGSSEIKLDLHGCHLASAYIILLQWMEELSLKFAENKAVAVEVSVVCGVGRHSGTRGESPVKKLVSEVMFRLNSPLKIDRKNVGRFIAKGKAVKEWMWLIGSEKNCTN